MTVTTTRANGNPAQSFTDEETGSRFYMFPGDPTKYWSVTTALGVMFKDGLPPWAASLAARFAFEELPNVVFATRLKPCGRTYYKCQHEWRMPHTSLCACGRCEPCMRKWLTDRHRAESGRRADEGKRTHYVIEWWALHKGEWIGYDKDIAPYVEAFRALVAEYGLTPDDWLLTEATVVHRADVWAGTTDGVVRFHANRTRAAAELVARLLTRNTGTDITAEEAAAKGLTVDVMIDFKTQDKPVEKEKFYPDQALQLAAYRQAPVFRIPGIDAEEAMPDTDGAALIHLRPDGCTVRLVLAGDEEYEAFRHALFLYRWSIESGTAAVSVRTFPLPKPKKAATPRKAAKKAAPALPAPEPVRLPLDAPARAAAARPVADRVGAYPRPAGAQLTDSDIPF